jgi:hypothetical protein
MTTAFVAVVEMSRPMTNAIDVSGRPTRSPG